MFHWIRDVGTLDVPHSKSQTPHLYCILNMNGSVWLWSAVFPCHLHVVFVLGGKIVSTYVPLVSHSYFIMPIAPAVNCRYCSPEPMFLSDSQELRYALRALPLPLPLPLCFLGGVGGGRVSTTHRHHAQSLCVWHHIMVPQRVCDLFPSARQWWFWCSVTGGECHNTS